MTAWIGLTGGIGSGKSQAAAEFLHFDVPLIDADAISRELTAENGAALPAIREAFGDGVFDSNACLKRDTLRQLVFSREEAKQKLESLLHPLIQAEMLKQKQAFPSAIYGIIELPLLAEKTDFRKQIDRVLLIDCPEAVRLQRVMQRNGLAEQEVRKIMANQASDTQRRSIADDILTNNGTVSELKEKVGRLHRYYQYSGCFPTNFENR